MSIECQKCGARAQLFLCNQCIIWLRRQLLGMPTLIGYLNDTALGLTRLSNESSRQLGFESRTPTFNDRASNLVTEIERVLAQWARPLAITHGYVISAPINRNPIGYTHTSTDYATFLAAHVNDLAGDEYVGELCASLRRHVRAAVGDEDYGDEDYGGGIINRRIPDQFCGPCPATINDHQRCVDETGAPTCSKQAHECSTSLMTRRGAPEVTCSWCGAVHDVQRVINHLLARSNDFRGTIPELYRVLRMIDESVKLDTLYHWAEPRIGKLKPAGYLRPDNRRIGITRQSDQDRPIYRVSDARKQRGESAKPGRVGRPLNKVTKKKGKK